jgi:hypothetical protein
MTSYPQQFGQRCDRSGSDAIKPCFDGLDFRARHSDIGERQIGNYSVEKFRSESPRLD